jgi:hypothetical protein
MNWDAIENLGEGSQPGRDTTTKGHVNTPPRPVSADASPVLAGISLTGWKREDANRLHRLFSHAEQRIDRGQTLSQAFKQTAWYYLRKPRFYRSDRDRRVRLKRGTLIRRWYVWKKGGRTPEAVALRYRPLNKRISSDQVIELAKICVASDVPSLRVACQRLSAPAGTPHAFRDTLPTKLRRSIAALLAARRAVLKSERQARRAMEQFERGLL